MLFKKGFTFLVLFLSISTFVKADVGCTLFYANSSKEITYFTVIGTAGTGPWVNYGGSPTYNNIGFPYACPRYVYSTAIRVVGARCCVNGVCDTGVVTRVNFTPLPCPIDDYIPLMLIAAGGAGVVFLRKNIFLPQYIG